LGVRGSYTSDSCTTKVLLEARVKKSWALLPGCSKPAQQEI